MKGTRCSCGLCPRTRFGRIPRNERRRTPLRATRFGTALPLFGAASLRIAARPVFRAASFRAPLCGPVCAALCAASFPAFTRFTRKRAVVPRPGMDGWTTDSDVCGIYARARPAASPAQANMRQGAAVAFEKSESSCCFSYVLLSTKKLTVLSYDVEPIFDEQRDWALCANRTINPRIQNLPTLNSLQIKEKIAAEIKGVDIFFIRDNDTLNLLTNVFCIDKERIHLVKRSLSPSINLYCAPCATTREFENCTIDTVICISNLLCNLRAEYVPPGLLIASAAHPFSFAASVSRFPQSAALPTADISKCARYTSLYDSSPDSD